MSVGCLAGRSVGPREEFWGVTFLGRPVSGIQRNGLLLISTCSRVGCRYSKHFYNLPLLSSMQGLDVERPCV